jgi:tRNA threonylcarbamoyl adenosine modification protein (Sua5/YciO/YrdC/YwlC family)
MLYDCTRLEERERGVKAAVEAVQRGDLVVLPTDTVFGIGGDAFKSWAVTALQNARGRDRRTPVSVLVGSRHTLDGLVYGLPATARDLVEAFWPGALTIIVEHASSLQWDLGETGGKVAVRMPVHPGALEVLRETGPMAVSCAYKEGGAPATTAEEARELFGYTVSVYLEAPVSPDPMSSTIVDVSGPRPVLVRAGAITYEQLLEVAPELDAG